MGVVSRFRRIDLCRPDWSAAQPRRALIGPLEPFVRIQHRRELQLGSSGNYAIDGAIDGESKPLVAIASDPVRSVSSKKRKSAGRQAGEGLDPKNSTGPGDRISHTI